MFRAQFAFPLPPAPCFDQACLYSFDSTNCPVFQGLLTAGSVTPRVPLKLDKDADFYLRAISQQGTVSIRLEDADGNPLSDSENLSLAPGNASTNYEFPPQYSQTKGAGYVALEGGKEGIPARAGGNYLVYLYNAGATTIELATCALNLVGVKRYPGEVCP